MGQSLDQKSNPVLVTGLHRSGTTWLGKMLATSGQLAYIHEPFNLVRNPSLLSTPATKWYQYICRDNESEYLEDVRNWPVFRFPWRTALKSCASVSHLKSTMREALLFRQSRRLGRRALVKDPFTLFSAIWFSERVGFTPVFAIRHPLAQVSSLKRLGWNFQLEDLVSQPLLVRDWLAPFQRKLEGLPDNDVVGRGAYLWKVAHTTVREIQRILGDTIVVRHEDLSFRPLFEFGKLFQRLNLCFDARVASDLESHTGPENPPQTSTAHDLKIDSRANLKNWQSRLSREDVYRIEKITGEVVDYFYPEGYNNLLSQCESSHAIEA